MPRAKNSSTSGGEMRKLLSGMIALRRQDSESRPDSWWNLLVLWPIPFVLFFCIHSSDSDMKVAQRQKIAIAKINTHDPPNHDRYGYFFYLNRKPYTGWAYPDGKRDFSIGESVAVYYDPLNPSKNSADDYYAVSLRDLFFVPFCILVLVGLSLFILFRRRAWKKKFAMSVPKNTL